MKQIAIHLTGQSDGSVGVAIEFDDQRLEHRVSAQAVDAIHQKVAPLARGAETNAELLLAVGNELRDVFLKPIYDAMLNGSRLDKGRLLIASDQSECLRLPWELLPAPDGGFLVTTGQWNILRAARKTLLPPSAGLGPLPLRVVFCACAPTDLAAFDYEQEEAAMVRLAHELSGKVHIEIAESGSFAEVCKLVAELKPQIVHVSGHGILKGRMGCFAFENEEGLSDVRGSPVIADGILSGKGVRILMITGDQSSQAGAAALCEVLAATNQVSMAITWTRRMAEELGFQFVHGFLQELVQGHNVESSIAQARQQLNQHLKCPGDGGSHDTGFAWQQVYAAEDEVYLIDRSKNYDVPVRPLVRHELLGDNICGLAEGFVGRRRLLQRTGPYLRRGEKRILLLTGISGSGRSTLATHLANTLKGDGFEIASVQARKNETSQFRLRLLGYLGAACGRLGREKDKCLLQDGKRPVSDQLSLAVAILNRAKILLVLDNIEDLLTLPPAAPGWCDPEMAYFFRQLTSGLKGEGRVILTCSHLPKALEVDQKSIAHEPLPEFTVVDFFKYLKRNDELARQIELGGLRYDLVATFHRKLGISPRFVKQAAAILASVNTAKLEAQLEKVPEGLSAEQQQAHFRDQFLSELYDRVSAEFRVGLSRIALVELPLPIDGVAQVSGLELTKVKEAVLDWFIAGLVLEFSGEKSLRLISVHPLQREFFTHPARLPSDQAKAGHSAAATFFQSCFELNREVEMRWSITGALVACLQHAAFAGDEQVQRWAAVRLSRRLSGLADDRAIRELIEPLLREPPLAVH